MTAFVVDASVALKWFIPEIHEAEAKRFLDPGNTLYAPDLLPSEFGNILWKKVRRAEITEGEAERIAMEMRSAPVTLVSSLDLLPNALHTAIATGRTVYDSMYLVPCGLQAVPTRYRGSQALERAPTFPLRQVVTLG
ncbi:MAG TPA: type II toxin-antitoxin system VapC family toxin [Pyrinomonadaceae bacterium]|nr:type II toxin-antitoxin system VapC family toxin [Pyrinomonadaceae bacterium]